MTDKLRTSVTVRHWPKNQERLRYAENLGLNLSEIINAVLDKHLGDYLKPIVERKKAELQKALAAPVPE